ncbi:MAG: glucosamine-6-phosphate deaminase [Ilumatobacter sp.]
MSDAIRTPCTPARVATWVADRMTERVEQGARVLGVATGNSPLPVYELLIERHQSGEANLSDCDLVLLDEYVGVPREDPRSFHNTIMRVLAEPIGIPPERVLAPDGCAVDLAAACRDFGAAIESTGGVDVQLLGIGRNGHIAFNEPGTPWHLGVHVAELSETTRRDNASAFESFEAVPHRALTQGVATLLRADEIILIATGHAKAAAVRGLIAGSESVGLPATSLWRHPRSTLVTDAAALV